MIPNENCHMCGVKLTEENVAMKDWEPYDIRLDAHGKAWCKKCTDKYDSIDWGKFFT